MILLLPVLTMAAISEVISLNAYLLLGIFVAAVLSWLELFLSYWVVVLAHKSLKIYIDTYHEEVEAPMAVQRIASFLRP